MLQKNLVSSVLTQVPLFVLGVVVGIFSTRILGEEGKGVVALFQANNQFFFLVFSLGIQSGIVYFVSSKKMAQSVVVGMSLILFAVSSLILFLLFVGFHFFGGATLIFPEGYTTFPYYACLYLLFAITFFNTTIAAFFQAHHQFILLNWISIANSCVNVLLFGGLFFYMRSRDFSVNERINGVLIFLLISIFINALVLFLFQLNRLKLSVNFQFRSQEHLKPFLFYNFSVYIGMFINFFNYRMDLWIINHYLDKKALSYYALAANIIQIMLYIAVAIGSVLLPNLSAKNKDERKKTFARVSRVSSLFFIVLCLTAFLLSDYIIPLAYGEDFRLAVTPFQLLLPGAYFACMMQLFYHFILASNQNQWNVLANILGFVFTCIGGFLLIPSKGIIGASWITSCCYFVIFCTCFYFVTKIMGGNFKNMFFPLRNDFKFVKSTFLIKR